MTVSVVIPAYNAAGTLERALDSVAAQTFADHETLVVDDASTDDTVAVATRFRECRPDLRLRCVPMDRNSGPAAARNRGIAEAAGTWIAFLDADDAWHPWRLRCQMAALGRDATLAAVCARTSRLVFGMRSGQSPTLQHGKKSSASENGGTTSVSSGENAGFPQQNAHSGSAPIPSEPQEPLSGRELRLDDFVEGNPVATSTVLVAKAALLEVGGFDEQFRGPEDLDLWLRLVAARRMRKLDAVVANYSERAGSLSLDPDRFLPQVLRVYEKAFADGGVLSEWRRRKPAALAARHASAAWSYALAGRRGKALRVLLTSWRLCPGRLTVERRQPLWRAILLFRILLGQVR